MDPQLFDLIVEGIAAGTCPIADDADLRVLLRHLEALARKDRRMAQQPPTPTPTNPTPEPVNVPPTDSPRPTPPVVTPTPTRRRR
jgi:hypothetical protein